MKKFALTIIAILLLALGVLPFMADAQSAATWIPTTSYLKPYKSTLGIRVPALASASDCLITDADGDFSTTACASGSGTVTSVAMTVPTGLTVSGNPITTSGTLAVAYDTGYEGWTSSASTTLFGFRNTPSTRITAGTGIDWSSNTLNGVYTAGDGITLNTEDFDFDGGASPAGALGGTWASPTVDDDGHAHTGSTLSAILTGDITDGTLIEPDLDVDDSPSDGEILTYDTTGTNFVWETILALVNAITGAVDWGGITSFEIPNGSAPTVDTLGEIALDTTDNQFLVATGTAARAIPTITKLWGGTVASTSVDFVTGGRIPLPPHRDGVMITEIHCYVDGGTSKIIKLDTMAGGAETDNLTCATTLTSDTAMSVNYSLAAGALMALELTTTSGTVDYVTFSVWGYVKPE